MSLLEVRLFETQIIVKMFRTYGQLFWDYVIKHLWYRPTLSICLC